MLCEGSSLDSSKGKGWVVQVVDVTYILLSKNARCPLMRRLKEGVVFLKQEGRVGIKPLPRTGGSPFEHWTKDSQVIIVCQMCF